MLNDYAMHLKLKKNRKKERKELFLSPRKKKKTFRKRNIGLGEILPWARRKINNDMGR